MPCSGNACIMERVRKVTRAPRRGNTDDIAGEWVNSLAPTWQGTEMGCASRSFSLILDGEDRDRHNTLIGAKLLLRDPILDVLILDDFGLALGHLGSPFHLTSGSFDMHKRWVQTQPFCKMMYFRWFF